MYLNVSKMYLKMSTNLCQQIRVETQQFLLGHPFFRRIRPSSCSDLPAWNGSETSKWLMPLSKAVVMISSARSGLSLPKILVDPGQDQIQKSWGMVKVKNREGEGSLFYLAAFILRQEWDPFYQCYRGGVPIQPPILVFGDD